MVSTPLRIDIYSYFDEMTGHLLQLRLAAKLTNCARDIFLFLRNRTDLSAAPCA